MANISYISETITSAGATIALDITTFPDALVLAPDTIPVSLLADVIVTFSGTPIDGQSITVAWGHIDLNGNAMTINGISVSALQAILSNGQITFGYIDGIWTSSYTTSLNLPSALDAAILVDSTVTLAKIEDLASGKLIVGSGADRPTAVTPTGDVTISNTGVTAIGSGVIVNADINASAAIARTKIASGTASQVIVNDGSGILTSEAQLSAVRGGNGQDFSSSTGFQTWSAGVASVGAISEIVTLQVSFESGYLGDFKILMPFAGTVTDIYAYATKVIAGTDNGTIVAKNNGGTTMTNGTITFTASDARGTAYSVSPSANNTFADGDLLTFTTAKTTAGGVVQLSITVTRTS